MRSTLTRRSLPVRTGVAAFAAFSTLGLAACGADTAGAETGADVEDVTEDEPIAEGPYDGVHDAAFYDDIDTWVGKEVTLSADVNEVITPTAFTIAGTDDTSVEPLLIVGASENNELAPEVTVGVTGTVHEAFVITDVEEELGVDLDDALFEEYDQENYVVATDVEILENAEG